MKIVFDDGSDIPDCAIKNIQNVIQQMMLVFIMLICSIEFGSIHLMCFFFVLKNITSFKFNNEVPLYYRYLLKISIGVDDLNVILDYD